MRSGIVKDYKIGTNADGDENVVLLVCEITSSEDVQTVEYIQGSQNDSIPEIGTAVYIIDVAGNASNKIAIVCDSNIESTVENGEKKIYAQDNGSIESYIYLKKDGTIEINGNTDFAVNYNNLEISLTNQDTLINAELTKLTATISAMVTAFSALGVTIPPYVQGAVTTDITSAKNDKVLL